MGFFWILFIGEIMDGSFQSMGWSSAVRANAENSRKLGKNIEKRSCALGTSYQIGNSITWLVSSLVVGLFGWQWGFLTASGFMFLRGITLLINRPRMKFEKQKVQKQLKKTIQPPIVIAGFAMMLLNIVRYGIIVWIPTYLIEVQGSSIIGAGLKIFLIPVAGVFGTLIYNKSKMNRDFLTIIFLAVLSSIFIFYGYLSNLMSVVVLILSGFFLYGPHVFLVSTFPSKFLKDNVVGASTGFIDGMAYVGAIIVGLLVPFLLDISNWALVFLSWSTCCLMIILLVMFLYVDAQVDGKKAKERDILNLKEAIE